MTTSSSRTAVRLHLTNVAGAGASQLLQSLLPALESDLGFIIERIDLPDRGVLATYTSTANGTVTNIYRRYLPNMLSRALECTWLASRFDGNSPLLVFGDLPLRCRGPQMVFVQTPNLLKPARLRLGADSIKYWVSRNLFRIGIDRVHAFIVQTEVMRDALEKNYPSLAGRVHVVSQPVPAWLLRSGLRRTARAQSADEDLQLIYPAAGYPHKNHVLLSKVSPQTKWPVKQLILTIDSVANPAPELPWVSCQGFLSQNAMIEAYTQADALMFLSKQESYGFPLMEAMFIGLPIICPDLPYARTLCGEQAIYFNPDEPESLLAGLHSLQTLLRKGWWPNWTERLANIPKDWESVAKQMLVIACNQKPNAPNFEQA